MDQNLKSEFVRAIMQMHKDGELNVSEDEAKRRLSERFDVVSSPYYNPPKPAESGGWGGVAESSASGWWSRGWGSSPPPREM